MRTLKQVCALGRSTELLMWTMWTLILMSGSTTLLPMQNRRNQDNNLLSFLLLRLPMSHLEILASCRSSVITWRFSRTFVWVGVQTLYTAWISSPLTPSQNEPIPSLSLVIHIKGLAISSVSDSCVELFS